MTIEELIKGLYCIRAIIESNKDMPEQTENQLSVIDKVIADIQTHKVVNKGDR